MAKTSDPRTPYIRSAITDYARQARYNLHRVFEEAGCSCQPLRQQLEELEQQCKAAEAELRASNPIFMQREILKAKIAEADLQDHPRLNQVSQVASPFFRVWLFDRLSNADPQEELTSQELALEYAQAWLAGWRPLQPERKEES